ncbi:MAG: hypothetical protein U1A77_18215 [Pirellulales bacterium]
MVRWLLHFSIVAMVCALGGCQQAASTVDTGATASSESGDPNAAKTADAKPGEAKPRGDKDGLRPASPMLPAPSATPQEVVHAFLDASRGGHEEFATELLSDKAREATSSQGLALDPPGSSSMVYRIGDVEFPMEDRQAAYVSSIWREDGVAAAAEQFEVTWILRRQQEGWRIAGMASRAEAEAEPVLINFEDISDLHKIKPSVGGEPVVE